MTAAAVCEHDGENKLRLPAATAGDFRARGAVGEGDVGLTRPCAGATNLPIAPRANWRWLPQLRHSSWDGLLVLLALLHGAVLLSWPSALLIAVGFLWNSNTIAHYFIHLPFFRQRLWNRFFSAYQTLLLGVPQRLWRDRHLAHHAQLAGRLKWSRQLMCEAALVFALWAVLLAIAPRFFLTVYVPGYALGLCLCFLQGHYEHARGTTSHYGRIYNSLFLNDGYHVEHHARPSTHWRTLSRFRAAQAQSSRWPAALRWIESINLELFESLVLRSTLLQRFVLSRHAAAFDALLPAGERSGIQTLAIVGGGLFPRTALVLRKLLPECVLTVIEENPAHVAIARRWLGEGCEFVVAHYDDAFARQFDAVVIPLAFRGNRKQLCAGKVAPILFVHDWVWRRRRNGKVISWLLLKRLNRLDR